MLTVICRKLLYTGWCTLHAGLLTAVFLCMCLNGYGNVTDSNLVINFNFNNHNYMEAAGRMEAKPVGVTLVEDRFGNAASAVFLMGHLNSYLNLGTSPLLKAPVTTISLWVKIADRIYAGRGYDHNPIYLVKNGPGDDFILAYNISFHGPSGTFIGISSLDSANEAIINYANPVKMGKWYHLVLAANNRQMWFYVNGRLEGVCKKNFVTPFLQTDSVLIGSIGSKKNQRFLFACVDDIQVFHRVLNEQEILALYQAPDPNRTRRLMRQVMRWAGFVAGIFAVSFLLVWRRRRALRVAREKLELQRRLHETEIRRLKAQMNPHFIFNALNAVQQFVMGRRHEEAELYLGKFAKLLRELLETNTRECLTLEEEMSILNGYLEMEALRFSGAFSFKVEAEAGLNTGELYIPHLMVQPFAENAVWHGLLPKNGNRQLHISFHAAANNTLRCKVYDNGAGRAAGGYSRDTFRKTSLALSLVQQRLQLLNQQYGQQCGVSFMDHTTQSGAAAGTTVIIDLPLLKP